MVGSKVVIITTGGVPAGGFARGVVRWRLGGRCVVVEVGDRKRYVSSQIRPIKAARIEPYVFNALRWRSVVVEEREGVYAAAEVDDFRG